MNYTKLISFIIIPLAYFTFFSCNSNDEKVIIAVAKYCDHPVLDIIEKSFSDELKDREYINNKEIIIYFYNAYGDSSRIKIITDKLAGSDYDLILSLADPISKSIHNSLAGKIPVIYAAVDSVDIYNKAPVIKLNNVYLKQFSIIKQYFPQFNNIGIPYYSKNWFTGRNIEQIKEAADSLQINLVLKTYSNDRAAPGKVYEMANKCNAVYIPMDNSIINPTTELFTVADELNLPVIAEEKYIFDKNDAVIGFSNGYKESGKKIAELALLILKNENIENLSGMFKLDPKLLLNQKIAKRYNIIFPENLVQIADTIISN